METLTNIIFRGLFRSYQPVHLLRVKGLASLLRQAIHLPQECCQASSHHWACWEDFRHCLDGLAEVFRCASQLELSLVIRMGPCSPFATDWDGLECQVSDSQLIGMSTMLDWMLWIINYLYIEELRNMIYPINTNHVFMKHPLCMLPHSSPYIILTNLMNVADHHWSDP